MKRREFLRQSGLAAGAFALRPGVGRALGSPELPEDPSAESNLSFTTSDAACRRVYQHALRALAGNVAVLPSSARPVLIEGSSYRGVWLECAPQEGLAYSAIRPDLALNNHLIFFELQRDDGQIPCSIKTSEIGFGQIQMVVPIAATAWDLYRQTGSSELLETAYQGGSRWDAWLRQYRDTRHTGLCEGFCTYDTGHDNSPRWAGLPNRCPDADARKCPAIASLPRLCPDLSATVYGGRVALARMARELGRGSEADRWLADAEAIRSLILSRLYSAEDAAFYDVDAQGKFVRIRGDVISRVLGEHVVDQKLFATIYQRQMHNPAAFWAPYPFPSIALNDPAFVRPIPRNSWGGAAQALTALRAPRWMEHYGKPAALARVMQKWVEAIGHASDFYQQMDPLTGAFTIDPGGYSPAALVLVDFTWRLAGVRQTESSLEWNVRPPAPGVHSSFLLQLRGGGSAEIRYSGGHAELLLNRRVLLRTSDTVRLVTDSEGKLKSAAGISAGVQKVTLQRSLLPLRERLPLRDRDVSFSIAPDESRMF
ncbi:MAG TPA: alpha-L-rhamnosidase [Acidobacteriaceae bacterium]|nr:alpha-L-rhamnosidase [Acidobacteriaceae bacterium]